MLDVENNYRFYFYYPVEYILQNACYHSTRETQITLRQGYYYNQGGIDQEYIDFEIFLSLPFSFLNYESPLKHCV